MNSPVYYTISSLEDMTKQELNEKAREHAAILNPIFEWWRKIGMNIDCAIIYSNGARYVVKAEERRLLWPNAVLLEKEEFERLFEQQRNNCILRCRKTALISARQLTTHDHDAYQGIIQTLEGPASFNAGDYLARDSKGMWPITRENIEQNYRQMSEPDQDGFARYQALHERRAIQMHSEFMVNGLHGKPGDYLVFSQGGHTWPVDQEIFNMTYEVIS